MRAYTVSLALLSTLALAGSASRADAQAGPTPCFDCRTDECPSLQAPPCAANQAKKKVPPRRRTQAPRPVQPPDSPAAAQPPPAAVPVQGASAAGAPAPAPAAPALAVNLDSAAPAPETARRPISLRPWKWTALGVGVGLTGAGAALLAVNGTLGDCTQPGNPATCGLVLHTQAAGAALVGVGGAALVGAVVLFVLDARRDRRHPAVAWTWKPR